MLSRVIENSFCYSLDNENMLKEVMVKIGLDKKFARKQSFKLKKIKRPIYKI